MTSDINRPLRGIPRHPPFAEWVCRFGFSGTCEKSLAPWLDRRNVHWQVVEECRWQNHCPRREGFHKMKLAEKFVRMIESKCRRARGCVGPCSRGTAAVLHACYAARRFLDIRFDSAGRADVATTGNSGSGVFDAGQKCLLGIMSRKIMVNSAGGKHKDIAKYFVPAATIRAFIPTNYRF